MRMRSIGERIKLHRIELGIEQKELASRLGITSGYLSKLERGLCQPSPEILEKLENVLNISSEQLRPKLTRTQKNNMLHILSEEELMQEYNSYHPIIVKILYGASAEEDTIFPAILDISDLNNNELAAYYSIRKLGLYMRDYGTQWIAYHYYEALIDEEREQN